MKINFENEIKELALKYEASDIYKLKKIIEEKIKNKVREMKIFKTEFRKAKKMDIIRVLFILFIILFVIAVLMDKTIMILYFFSIIISGIICLINEFLKFKKANENLYKNGIDIEKIYVSGLFTHFPNIREDLEELIKDKELIEKIIKLENEVF